MPAVLSSSRQQTADAGAHLPSPSTPPTCPAPLLPCQGTLHFGGQWPGNAYTTAYYELPGGTSFADDWHVFRLDWTQKQAGLGAGRAWGHRARP